MRRSSLMIMALLASLLPGPLPANAVPVQSAEYLLSSLKIDGVSLPTIKGEAFDPYATVYVYNIPSADFESITVEWVKPAGSRVDVALQSGGALRAWNDRDQSVSLSEENFCVGVVQNNDCLDADRSPLNVIYITVTSEDGSNTITYQVKVVRPLMSDFWNYDFWPMQPMSGIDGGNAPELVTSKRGYIQVPDEGTMTKSGYVLQGWQDQDDPTKLYKPGEFIYIDRFITADPVWVLDLPDLSISVEGEEPVEVYANSALSHYVSFDVDNPNRINFSVTSDARFQVALYTYPPTELAPDGAILDAIDSATTARKFLNTDYSCEDVTDPDCPNLFRLEVIAHSPSGQQPPKTVNIYLLRRYSPGAEPSFRINWTEEESVDTPVSQGWVQLPRWAPDEFSPSPTHVVTSYTQTIGDVTSTYEPGDYVPVFTDQTFDAVFTELDITPSVNLFGQLLTFDWCTNPDLLDEFCLSFNGQVYEPENSVFYITVPLVDPLLEMADHRQRIEVTWSNGEDGEPFEGYSSLTSLDIRREYWPMYEAVPDVNNQFSDEELCPDGLCHEAWALQLENDEFDGYEFSYYVAFVLSDDPAAFYTVNFANDESVTPFQTVTSPRGWVTLPDLEQRSKSGHIATAWTSELSWGDLEMARYPILENDTIYPVWFPQFMVRFFDGETFLEERELIGVYELGELDVDPPISDYEFLGWSPTPVGTAVSPDFLIEEDTAFYAVWAKPAPRPRRPDPIAQPPIVVPDVPKPITKTSVQIERINGITKLATAVPAKYVNQPTQIEVRRVIAGKVRYYLIGKAWTHFEKTTQDRSQARMTFNFRLQLKPTDIFRVKVRNTVVIRSTGDGKPAWK